MISKKVTVATSWSTWHSLWSATGKSVAEIQIRG